MKVMFVNGSSHLHGTTMAAIEEMEKVFRAEGIETEVIQVGGKPIADCLQCNVCGKTGKCVFTDDGVNEFVEKAKDADGFVFATPVYFAHPSGRIFDFLDRTFYSSNGYENFKFKPGAAVAIARRGGRAEQIFRNRTDADRRLDLLEHGARVDGGGRAEGRRRDADDAQSCKKYDLDDALL